MTENYQDPMLTTPRVGVVIRNDDPAGLHRVKLRVPGIVDQTPWAWPLTSGGGSPQRGGHIVPAIGSDCIVQWIGGDHERPIYSAAHWGVRKDTGSEMPEDAKNVNEAHLIQSMQIGPLVFTVDERPRDEETGTGERFTIRDTVANSVILEYDFKLQGWTMFADYLIKLQAGGIVDIDALQVNIIGRPTRHITRQI